MLFSWAFFLLNVWYTASIILGLEVKRKKKPQTREFDDLRKRKYKTCRFFYFKGLFESKWLSIDHSQIIQELKKDYPQQTIKSCLNPFFNSSDCQQKVQWQQHFVEQLNIWRQRSFLEHDMELKLIGGHWEFFYMSFLWSNFPLPVSDCWLRTQMKRKMSDNSTQWTAIGHFQSLSAILDGPYRLLRNIRFWRQFWNLHSGSISDIQNSIMTQPPVFPSSIEPTLQRFISELLIKNGQKRLGSNFDDIENHIFFR